MPAPVPLQMQLIRLMRWAALISVAFAIVALVLLARGDSGVRPYKYVAMALGVGISVLIGAALMALPLLGRHGNGDSIKKEDNEPRS